MKITNNKERSRFETPVNGDFAFLDYVYHKGALALVHTFVPPKHRHQGIAFALVQFALDHAVRERLKVIPACSSVTVFIGQHPEYGVLIAND